MTFLQQPAPPSGKLNRPMRPGALGLAAAACAALATGFVIGCASPGPPRAPSLNLPQPVADLAAQRTADTVELRFTVPRLSTDKLPLYNLRRKRTALAGSICREATPGTCVTVAAITAPLTAADHTAFTWQETLPAELTAGPPRLLRYRVEFPGPHGRSAGASNPAFTAAGAAPAAVTGLAATGTRGGALLQWTPTEAAGDVLLRRTALAVQADAAKPPKRDADLWLNANASDHRTLDASVTADGPYRYTAVRRVQLTLGGHPVELRSGPSAPVVFTLRAVYPPAAPTGLVATGFTTPDADARYAVDLIWQPVADADTRSALAGPLAGYLVYRQTPNGPRTRLTPQPTPEPGFHDATADPAATYRYTVTAVDRNGNESAAAAVELTPTPPS